MIQEINVFDYSGKVLKKMNPGIFLTTKLNDVTNTMIIGWGGITVIWGKPIFLVLVRKTRATFDLIDNSNEFTISVPLTKDLSDAIKICGTKSLRDMDKFQVCHLTKQKGRTIDTPIIQEADLHFECKVIYKQALNENDIPQNIKNRYYQSNAYHTLFYGEIIDQYLLREEE